MGTFLSPIIKMHMQSKKPSVLGGRSLNAVYKNIWRSRHSKSNLVEQKFCLKLFGLSSTVTAISKK